MKKNSPKSFFAKYHSQLIALALTIIVALAGFIRVYELATLPSTLNRDEAALAYNAFLLSQTGKDEWERSWPVSLESFGDYKLPGYPLLLVGFFKVFGYNDFAVRLPSAIAGTLLVVLGYIFARKVLQLKEFWSLWVAATLALQPIFFFYSRMAWEANVGLLFFITGITFLLRSTEKKEKKKQLYYGLDSVGVFFLFLAIFTYNTPLLLLPCVVAAVILRRGLKNWKQYLFSLIGIASLFLLGFFVFSSISQQKSGITIFSDETLWQQSVTYYESFSGISQKVLGNRYVFFLREMMKRYIDSFSWGFLVQRGGQHPWHNLPNFGHMFVATYLLSLIGIVQYLWSSWQKRGAPESRSQLSILFLVFTSLLPSIITVDAPHDTRSLFFFFLLCSLSAVGLEFVWKEVSLRTQFRVSAQVFFVILFCIGFFTEIQRYYFNYFTHYPEISKNVLQAGLPFALESVEKMTAGRDEQVAVVDPHGFLYISAAWYLKMPPDQFFRTINHHLPDRIGLKYGYRVGRYRFIAHRQDRVPEDKHLVEWDASFNSWLIDK